MSAKTFPVWKEVYVGPTRAAPVNRERHYCSIYAAVLRAEGVNVTPSAEKSLEYVKLAKQRRKVRLVRVTPQELGAATALWFHGIRELGHKAGLQPCGVEAACRLRLAYGDQPAMDTVVVAMPQDELLEAGMRVLTLGHGGAFGRHLMPKLNLNTVDISTPFPADMHFVFALPDSGR